MTRLLREFWPRTPARNALSSSQRWETGVLTVEERPTTLGGETPTVSCPVNILEAEMPELLLELLDGGDGRMYLTPALRRFEFSEACASTFGESCFEREGCSHECGACTCRYGGGVSCSTASRLEDCTDRQGCSWDAAVCAGAGGDRCELRDFGRVPGCELVDVEQR